jgi:hypothetical protein
LAVDRHDMMMRAFEMGAGLPDAKFLSTH